ncbi:hypothetical protein [Candidatus Solirubrobacter pratensis]|uniref:hypothetical protein n=1 Tax=Candidatus Solirubrobacter pratensis TaxID=1298857 RepID=UPI000422C6B5|nr:hypothetical protein [Candidatus Solirubrobacter pratensis]
MQIELRFAFAANPEGTETKTQADEATDIIRREFEYFLGSLTSRLSDEAGVDSVSFVRAEE